MRIKDKYRFVLSYFERIMPDAKTELRYTDAFQLIVAVILSAQCTDKRVNMITPALFMRFPNATSMAEADITEIYEFIKSCTYPNNKARNLSGMARTLVEKFKGNIPSDPELLQELPGVGRKTANVLASVLFNRPVVAVDTHVFRVSARIGLVRNAKTPLKTERQLTENIPVFLRNNAHHWLILHGRYICKARTPLCDECGLREVCNFYKKNVQFKRN